VTVASSSERISEAKKGKPQFALDPEEITLQQAVKETGFSRKVLKDGVDDDILSHRMVERPGRQSDAIVFHLPTLRGELARRECSYPPCTEPAPGRSGRCGEHAARVKYETLELVCDQCGEQFTRPGSWLREREGRGTYCSNRCKGAAFAESRPGCLQALNPDGAREHHAAIAQEIATEGLLDRGQAPAVHPGRYSASSMTAAALAGRLPSQLRRYHGSLRRVYVATDVATWQPAWASDIDRRVSVARGTHGMPAARRIWGRIA